MDFVLIFLSNRTFFAHLNFILFVYGVILVLRSLKFFLHSFIVSFFCFSLMVMGAVLWLQPYTQKKESTTEHFISIPKENNTLNILITHVEESSNCSFLLSFRPNEGHIIIHPLSTAHSTSDYEKFVQINNIQLLTLVDHLGGVPIELQQPLHCTKDGISSILEVGTHTLTGEQVSHYIQQNGACTSLLSSVLYQLLPKLCAENGQEWFILLLDLLDTNLTVADYDNFIDEIAFMYRIVKNPISLQ